MNKNNNSNNSPFVVLLLTFILVACLPVYFDIMFTSMDEQYEEEVVEPELEEELVAIEEEPEQLFETVHRENLNCTIERFIPTDVLYLKYRDEMVMMTTEEGEPLTYVKYLELTE